MKNRTGTMIEHSCNELDLFNNPMLLLTHYFENSGVKLNEIEKKEIIDFTESRWGKQLVEAFLCPVNRHAVRTECKCSDEDLLKYENQNSLFEHFVTSGGAEAFAKDEKVKDESIRKDIAGCGK